MATISLAGSVTAKEGTEPVTVKVFESGDKVATFSMVDRQYVYTKRGDESFGQFYRCEVRGKAAEIASERLQRGDKIAVSGQLVQREYKDKVYLDVKNAQLTYLEPMRQEANSDSPF
jgi:single-stranded DNA-binding protein